MTKPDPVPARDEETEERVARVAVALQQCGAIPGYLADDAADALARAALAAVREAEPRLTADEARVLLTPRQDIPRPRYALEAAWAKVRAIADGVREAEGERLTADEALVVLRHVPSIPMLPGQDKLYRDLRAKAARIAAREVEGA